MTFLVTKYGITEETNEKVFVLKSVTTNHSLDLIISTDKNKLETFIPKLAELVGFFDIRAVLKNQTKFNQYQALINKHFD